MTQVLGELDVLRNADEYITVKTHWYVTQSDYTKIAEHEKFINDVIHNNDTTCNHSRRYGLGACKICKRINVKNSRYDFHHGNSINVCAHCYDTITYNEKRGPHLSRTDSIITGKRVAIMILDCATIWYPEDRKIGKIIDWWPNHEYCLRRLGLYSYDAYKIAWIRTYMILCRVLVSDIVTQIIYLI